MITILLIISLLVKVLAGLGEGDMSIRIRYNLAAASGLYGHMGITSKEALTSAFQWEMDVMALLRNATSVGFIHLIPFIINSNLIINKLINQMFRFHKTYNSNNLIIAEIDSCERLLSLSGSLRPGVAASAVTISSLPAVADKCKGVSVLESAPNESIDFLIIENEYLINSLPRLTKLVKPGGIIFGTKFKSIFNELILYKNLTELFISNGDSFWYYVEPTE